MIQVIVFDHRINIIIITVKILYIYIYFLTINLCNKHTRTVAHMSAPQRGGGCVLFFFTRVHLLTR